MKRVPVREPQSRTNLYDTYQKAYYDEFGPPLPLLFRIDELLGLNDGRLYRAECIVDPVKWWGVSICPAESDAGRPPEPDRTCLQRSHGSPSTSPGAAARRRVAFGSPRHWQMRRLSIYPLIGMSDPDSGM